jgi:predicted amidohydrolase
MSIIAAIQMCSSDHVAENLKTAGDLIAEAASHNAQLVVLPEMFAIMGKAVEDKIRVQETFGAGPIQEWLAKQSSKYGIWIIAGTIPLSSNNKDKVCAACLVFNDKGLCVARYDKMHLFDVELSAQEVYRESDTIEAGKKIVIVDTPFGKIGLAVCYDIRFPELFRSLFNQGVDIFVLPSAFTIKTGTAHWEVLLRARAIENFCYMIAAAQGGTHTNGRQTYGHSLIVEPWGEIIAKLPGTNAGVIYADIDLQKVKQARAAIPVDKHQKIV